MTGTELKKKRESLGLSQKELAYLVGVGKNTIYNYESGGKIPDSKIPILKKVLDPNISTAKPDKKQSSDSGIENIIAQKVKESTKEEFKELNDKLNYIKTQNRDLAEIVIGLASVYEELLNKVSDIQNKVKS